MSRWFFILAGVAGLAGAAAAALKLVGPWSVVLVAVAGLAGAALVAALRSTEPANSTNLVARNLTDPVSARPMERRNEQTPAISAVALLEATLNSMREGVLVVGPDTRILASNAAAQGLFDAGATRLENQRLIEVTRQPRIHEAFRQVLDTGERAEVTVETKSTDRRSFELRVAPLRVGEDQGRGAIGVFFDITRMESLERTRQEFLVNVSHELRTPLTAILAFVETLEEGAIDDPDNNWRFLEIIRKNAGRMQELIEDIMDLSSIEAGNVTLELQPVRLSRLVNDVVAAVSGRAKGRQIIVTNQVAPDIQVVADQRRLEQMLINLIDNAVKFNRDGGSVIIACEAGEPMRITVTDTGEGIPPEQAARIFERFYRVDRARSRELGGNGLGLAIVKHLARAHGGETHVHSQVGGGSVFTIELPAAVNPAAVGPATFHQIA